MGYDKRFLAIVALLLASAIVYIAFFGKPAMMPIEGVPHAYTDGTLVLVNSSGECESMGGRCIVDPGKTRYYDAEYDTTFFFGGLYKGNKTGSVYFSGGKKAFAVGQVLDPSDGITNGYMSFSIANGKITAKIFLDDDWKNRIGKTWIIWGKDWQNGRELVFNEVYHGTYYDSVEDGDLERFKRGYITSDGNFAVTDASPEEFREGRMAGKTALIYR